MMGKSDSVKNGPEKKDSIYRAQVTAIALKEGNRAAGKTYAEPQKQRGDASAERRSG